MALYADEALVTTQPFRAPERGRAGVRRYVAAAFAEESNVRSWFAEPVAAVDHAAVEWWAALTEDGREITLAGVSILRFRPDGLVIEQRDAWSQAEGRREPPAGWGR